MDRDVALRVLGGDEYADAVHADIREAAVRGAQGVPFFVIENGLGITGAQPAELLAQRMRAVADADRGSAAAA